MARRIRPLVTFLALVALALAAGACGGGNDAGENADADSRSPVTSIEKDDQEYAESFALQLSDFPTGWRATPPEESDDSALDFCTNLDFSDLVVTGRAESDEFGSTGVAQVQSLGVVFQDSADEAFDQYASDELLDCVTDYIDEQAREDPPEDAEIGEISVGELSFPALGDQSRAYQIKIEIEAEGLSPDAYADLVFIQKNRAIALLFFVDVLTQFDTDLKVELAETVAGRM